MVWCLCLPILFTGVLVYTIMSAENTLNHFEERIASLDVAIGRMSSLLDSMLPYPTDTGDMGTITTGRYERPSGWPASVDGDGFEREDVMSDISDDDTIEYYNEYDFGDIDEDTDDITFVPPWCVPYGYDRQLELETTPPAHQPSTEPPPLYRPRYLDDDYWT